MITIAAITRVLNEADIIEAFIRHTASFVMHHVIMDNGSADGTIEILAALKREGIPLTVYQSRSITYNESDSVTQLYDAACTALAPDWVLCIDVDEFLDDRRLPGGFSHHLETLLAGDMPPDYVKIPMVNYAATARDDAGERNAALRMRHRLQPTNIYKIIIRGALHDQGVSIEHGSHWARIGGKAARERIEPDLWLAHYSERSPYQYIVKFLRGWAKVLATGQAEIDRKTAFHYAGPFGFMRDDPKSLLRNPHFMGFKNEVPELIEDPIAYRGGALRYTPDNDEAMRAVKCLMGFYEECALRHGRLLDRFPEVREAVREWEMQVEKIL